MRDRKSSSGYRHSNQSNDTKVCEPIDSMAWETGYYKPTSLETGVMGKMVALSQCCSVTGIRGWGKPMSGKDSSLEKGNADVANNK